MIRGSNPYNTNLDTQGVDAVNKWARVNDLVFGIGGFVSDSNPTGQATMRGFACRKLAQYGVIRNLTTPYVSTTGNPTTITCTSHEVANGETVKIINITSSSPDTINNQTYTATYVNANTFTIPANVTACTPDTSAPDVAGFVRRLTEADIDDRETDLYASYFMHDEEPLDDATATGSYDDSLTAAHAHTLTALPSTDMDYNTAAKIVPSLVHGDVSTNSVLDFVVGTGGVQKCDIIVLQENPFPAVPATYFSQNDANESTYEDYIRLRVSRIRNTNGLSNLPIFVQMQTGSDSTGNDIDLDTLMAEWDKVKNYVDGVLLYWLPEHELDGSDGGGWTVLDPFPYIDEFYNRM